jgi:hypothetical protein
MSQYAYYARIHPVKPLPSMHKRVRSASRRSGISEAMRQSQIIHNPLSASLLSVAPHSLEVSTSSLHSNPPVAASLASLTRPQPIDWDSQGSGGMTSQLRASSKSRPPRSLILFSVWALFGLGMRYQAPWSASNRASQQVWHSSLAPPAPEQGFAILPRDLFLEPLASNTDDPEKHHAHLPLKWDIKIIIGRISSWTCVRSKQRHLDPLTFDRPRCT